MGCLGFLGFLRCLGCLRSLRFLRPLRAPKCPERAWRFGCAEGCSSSVLRGGRTQKSSSARDELYTRGATLVGQIHCPSHSRARPAIHPMHTKRICEAHSAPHMEAMPLPDNGGFRLGLLGGATGQWPCAMVLRNGPATRRSFGLRLRGPLAALFPRGLHCPPLAMESFGCDDLPLQRLYACTRFSCKAVAIPW